MLIQDGFWSHDYQAGIEALTKSLSVSVDENKQFLAMVHERAQIEHIMAENLARLSQEPVMHAVPTAGRYISKSSSLQSALSVFTAETITQAVIHTRIASDLESRVREPLQKWCNMYARRIDACNAKLNTLVAGYNRLFQAANKQKLLYYESCHKLEDSTSGGSPKDPIIKTIRVLKERLKPTELAPSNQGVTGRPKNFAIAGLQYTRSELAELLGCILTDVTLTKYRVPLLGSYDNVTSGTMLAAAARKHLQNDSFAYAEKFGQSLVDIGLIKPVGQISNRYQSSHGSYYQWQQMAFDLVDESHTSVDGGVSDSDSTTEAEQTSEAESTNTESTDNKSTDNKSTEDSSNEIKASTSTAGAVNIPKQQNQGFSSPNGKALSSRGSLGSLETNGDSTLSATDASEERYLQAVLELDKYRCDMEQDILQIYQFLDRLERDREEAIKRGMHDFIKVAFRLEDQQQSQARLRAVHNQVDPARDLRDLVAKNRTGPYVPTVTVFKGYFNGNVAQTFGVDLPHSKFFVDIVLEWLQTLPLEKRSQVSMWTEPEPLTEVYKLRTQINNGRPFSADSIFRFFLPSVVVSTFRQFLLELPESLVPFIVYERFKQLYAEGNPDPADIAIVLVQTPQINRSVLEQVIVYLRSQFSEDKFTELARSLSLPLARPRAPSAVTMDDKHPIQLIKDLLLYTTEIFSEVDAKEKEMKAAKDNRMPRLKRETQHRETLQQEMQQRGIQQPQQEQQEQQGSMQPGPMQQVSEQQVSEQQVPEQHLRITQPESPSPTLRVASNSALRPLSLSMNSSRIASLNLTPTKSEPTGNRGSESESASLKSPGMPTSRSVSRGLGITPMLPISFQPGSPITLSPRQQPSSPASSTGSSSSPTSTSTRNNGTNMRFNSDLRIPKVRKNTASNDNNNNSTASVSIDDVNNDKSSE